MEKQGIVYLVGAGPGDPGLITEKGLARLSKCDAVVYDYLASESLLDRVPASSRRIYVGKRAGHHSMKQEEINQVLVTLAREGCAVVRLKGGDPFVFGRGGEEILALLKESIPYEVVPGVTSAVAALSSVGIPVTHRAVSRSFHVMTGHTMTEAGGLPPDFHSFAKLDGTLIFLMGLGSLSEIVRGLLSSGKSENTPAAVVENGTLPQQRVVRGILGDIEEKVKSEGIGTPAIIVVGEVAALHMESTVHPPLEGISIGVTGTDSFTGKLMEKLQEEGASTECILKLGIDSHRKEAAMKQAYDSLSTYSWLVFTSANGVREFFAGLMEDGRDYRSIGHLKFATVGKGTAKELHQYGFLSDYTPERYQVSDLAEGLLSVVTKKDKLLIPRSSGGSPELNRVLGEAQIPFDDIVLYDVTGRKKKEQFPKALWELQYLTFASASGADAFFKSISEEERALLDRIKVVCIGDITAGALERLGRKADIVAEDFSIDGIAAAIVSDVQKAVGQINKQKYLN